MNAHISPGLNKLLSFSVKWLKYQSVYRRFKPYTMIPKFHYVRNLALVHKLSDVEGVIVECGTWRGGMIAGIARVLGKHRQYHLFDSFEGLPPARDIDGPSAARWQGNTLDEGCHDNCTASESDARKAMALSGATDVIFHKGWFAHTVPEWSKTEPRIALLRLDGDWYESTMVCLDELAHRVVPSGIIIIDDYYVWDGCAKAVYEFLSRELDVRMKQYLNGPCYITRKDLELLS